MNEDQIVEQLTRLIMNAPPSIVPMGCTGDALSVLVAVDTARHLVENGVTIRERGEWEVCSDEYEICASEFVCSNCKESFVSSELTDEQFFEMMKFCPHCGADLRGVEDE